MHDVKEQLLLGVIWALSPFVHLLRIFAMGKLGE